MASRSFTVDELCRHFGVGLQQGGRLPEGYKICGEAPSVSVQLFFHPEKGFLIQEDKWPDSDRADLVLHELMHAFVGPDSFEDEAVLMVVQWAFMGLLPDDERMEARACFGAYHLNYKQVGRSDWFLRTAFWRAQVQDAKTRRLVLLNGRPNLKRVLPLQEWAKEMAPAYK